MPAASARAQVKQDAPNPPEQGSEAKGDRQFAVAFDKNPQLRIGSHLRFDLHVKSQADWRDVPDESAGSSSDVFDLHRARLGLDGRISKYVEYQVEREMRDVKRPWRDVFVNVRPLRALQVRLGQFKIPFSLDQTTGRTSLDFAYRSLAATYLAPGRDTGVMAHGAVLKNLLKYEAGFFQEGGDNARVKGAIGPTNPRTIAGRTVFRPWRSKRIPPLRNLEVGAAFTAGQVPEGLNGLGADTVTGGRFVDPVYVKGLRRRLGAELKWQPGPASVQAEVIRVNDERREQGIENDNLIDAVQRGWYLSGTWLLTGEDKKNNIDPSRPLLQGGFGALEIGARVEAIAFGGGDKSQRPSPGPRAPRIIDRKDAAWTVGMNWYLNQFVRVQANLIRERREEGGSLLLPSGSSWSRTLRLQFEM